MSLILSLSAIGWLSKRMAVNTEAIQAFNRTPLAILFCSQGFTVLRFWNSDIDRNLNGVMETILSALNTPTPALRADPPHKGEG
jgi:hypothetical protein